MTPDTNTESIFETLLAEGMLEESDGGDAVRLTDEFRRNRDRSREDVGELGTDEFEAEANGFLAETSLSADDVEQELLIDAMAVYETCEPIGRETSLQVADSLDRIETTARESGVPAGFVSLAGEEVDAFLERNPVAVVYFWRTDCDPCDELKADLERLVEAERIPSDIALGAVIGPECPDSVLEAYEIGAAPTVLFCADGRVQSRFVGYPGFGPLKREIEILAEELEA